MKMNMEIYGQFLLSSQINYTCTYLADHLETLNHDNVSYFLAHTAIRPCNVWKAIRHTFVGSCEGYLLFDDTLASVKHRGIAYGCVLMDSWYAVTTIMKYIIGEQKLFYCPLKTNRKVDDSGGQNAYVQIQDLQWSDTELRQGKLIKVHKMAADS